MKPVGKCKSVRLILVDSVTKELTVSSVCVCVCYVRVISRILICEKCDGRGGRGGGERELRILVVSGDL